MFGLCGWFMLAALAFLGVGAEGEQNNWADVYVTALIVAGLMCGVLALLFGVVGSYRALTNRSPLRIRWPLTWHGDAPDEASQRAAWEQLRNAASEAELLQEKAEKELAEQVQRNEKLNDENSRLNESYLAKAEALGQAESNLATVRGQLEDLTAPAPPRPPAPANKELVIAVKTYGLPAHALLSDALSEMFDQIRNAPGIEKFLPELFSQSTGADIAKARDQLKERMDATDSPEAFDPIWHAFHWSYVIELMFWLGRVHSFHPLDENARAKLARWLPIHEKYDERLHELANAPDGQAIQSFFARFGGPVETYKQWLVAALNPPDPDAEGSSNG